MIFLETDVQVPPPKSSEQLKSNQYLQSSTKCLGHMPLTELCDLQQLVNNKFSEELTQC